MDFNKFVENDSENIVRSLQELIRIPSVKAPALEGKPFGEKINDALNYMLNLGQTLGFRSKNLDGYIGYIEFGQGEELVGILAHLDVVPEGKDWTYPPFAAEIHDNKVYGRGAIDDKGPAVAALYAMKAVKDSGVSLNKRVRLILGLDEESGWQCINHYKKTEEIPNLAFSPDADYPVIYAEKGIVNYKFSQQYENAQSHIRILKINGGNRPNMVPDFCEAIIEVEENLLNSVEENLKKQIDEQQLNIDYQIKGKTITFKSHGISAHGSTPEKGVNAISQLIVLLYNCMNAFNVKNNFFEFYNNCIGFETDAKSLNCALEDDVSGKLTFNVGLAKIDENYSEVVANIRYPVTYKSDDITLKLQNTIEKYNISLEKMDEQKPLYVPKEQPLVQKLLSVYREVTGDMREPKAIGGGTYARAIQNAVAFGAAFPGDPELAHQKDEYIGIDALIMNTKIYAKAIYELAKE